ncbi:MAG TPA: hypothetical protein VMY37_37345 [Thermoguttaceae bacterium]|nr:hypothetical protein [Thermoguttaceae bacterium]
MKKQVTAIVVFATLCVAVATWAFGQAGWRHDPSRGRPSQRPNSFLIDDVDPRRVQIEIIDRDDEHRTPKVRAVKPIERGPVGRYAVEEADGCTLLVDTMTGKTWALCPATSGRPADAVWLPIRRIDDKDEASLWRDHQEDLKRKATKGEESKRR